ncbi:MAG: type II secretion system F family protein [Candidatus Aenigmarchaeota archaeon]|nr:type II secretion system F family protein [Candidatus Aenigmarchaeota archaeon]
MFAHFLELFFVVVGLSIIGFNIATLSEVPIVFPLLNLVGGLIAVVPSLMMFYSKYRKKRVMEDQFLVFIADLTEAINSGMTLPLALEHISKRDYRALNEPVKYLASQVDWGIPFQKALSIFAKKTNSSNVRRSVETITQTYKVGGKIADTLHSIGESLSTIDKLKKERASSVHSQIITSYIIFFVFILILIILQVFLIPTLIPQTLSGISGAAIVPLQEVFAQSFVNFIIVQGFFAGLVTGKLSEGSVMGGVKHSVLLISIGYTIFSITSQMEIRFI